MNSLENYITQLQTPEFIGVFLLMLSTFLIGYFFGFYLEKTKKRALINRLKKEVNTLRTSKKTNDIQVHYQEIKPNKLISAKQQTADSQSTIIPNTTKHSSESTVRVC